MHLQHCESKAHMGTCNCDDCGRVKNEMKSVRDELRFLSHQVSQLIQAFAVKYCQCRACDSGVHHAGAGRRPSPTGASLPIFNTNPDQNDQSIENGKRHSSEQNEETEDQTSIHTSTISPADSPKIDFTSNLSPPTRKRSYTTSSVIDVHQLLPRFLSNENIRGVSRTQSLTICNGSQLPVIDEKVEKIPISVNPMIYCNDYSPPAPKMAKLDFAHLASSLEADEKTIGNMKNFHFSNNQASATLNVNSVELPKNCVENSEKQMENAFLNSPAILPIIPSTFLQNDEDRNFVKDISPISNIPSVSGPGLPLVSYAPRSATFFCGVCKREFSSVYYKRHMIVHTNARPYVCDVCGKRFNERSNMMKHRQRLHV